MSEQKIIKIAIIDDHDLLRESICQFLKDHGLETVFEAENGQLALIKMEACEMLPDLCIVDVNMPVMDGFETVKSLRAKYPLLKFLAFSVNDDENDVVQMLRNGADGYILKGADPQELAKAIRVICDGGRYFSAGICEVAKEYFKPRLQS
ncbi:response regulator transcription factor [Chitinophaga sp. 212800010-3]|uniref:response regulator n=1 Tax=Bacteroidota TaxID=976 RepID=UPI001AC5FC4B|nr:response regulator transcription factor [Chitinophaga sp. 212800010-3]MBN8880551.1 response regulator transcription factor [Sphingobacteriales bacterium]MBN9484413.1 response regulator transcription factor [Bacteroidota bacterium]MEC5143497.1 Response regulatory domain-containing protein [Chitinophaga sp. 212800010-3]